jgi:long-chain acyl-CoA synthetase
VPSLKPWLANYPPGVGAEIEAPSVPSLAARLLAACSRYPERTALSCGDRRLTYSDLEHQSRRMGAWLAAAGLKKGDRIALMCPNVPELPVATLAAHRLGLVVVNVNPLYTARELKAQLTDSGALAIIVASTALAVFAAIAVETKVRHCVIVPVGDGAGRPDDLELPYSPPVWFAQTLEHSYKLPTVEVGPKDLAFLQYTGGTTGTSKGAMLDHGNVLANLAQIEPWLAPPSDAPLAVITALPLYHIFALTVNELLFLGRGAELVLITSPRAVDSIIDAMRAHPPGFITGVNTLFNAIADHPRAAEVDFRGLHMAMGGGTAIQTPVSRRWETLTGKPIVQGYGLSETAPVLTICDPRAPFDGSIGLPVPSTEIEIRDPATGEPVPTGERGELCARGPQVMRGYWQRPDTDGTVFYKGGWFRTGDVAMMEADGKVTLVDRTKDMILVSGFNVYPNEVEGVCAEHPPAKRSRCSSCAETPRSRPTS